LAFGCASGCDGLIARTEGATIVCVGRGMGGRRLCVVRFGCREWGEIWGRGSWLTQSWGGGGKGECYTVCAGREAMSSFAHKHPDLHRNKGLAGGCTRAVLCDDSFNGGAILPKKRVKRSGQEQRKRGSGSQRETGGFRKQTGDRMFQDGDEHAHAIAEVTETRRSAGASPQA